MYEHPREAACWLGVQFWIIHACDALRLILSTIWNTYGQSQSCCINAILCSVVAYPSNLRVDLERQLRLRNSYLAGKELYEKHPELFEGY